MCFNETLSLSIFSVLEIFQIQYVSNYYSDKLKEQPFFWFLLFEIWLIIDRMSF